MDRVLFWIGICSLSFLVVAGFASATLLINGRAYTGSSGVAYINASQVLNPFWANESELLNYYNRSEVDTLISNVSVYVNSSLNMSIADLNSSIQGEILRAEGNESYLQSQVTSNYNLEQSDNSIQAGQIATLNSSKAATGSSSACGFGVQSFILSASGISVACAAQQGTVTSVSGGDGLSGTVTSSGFLSINSPACSVGEASFWNGSAWSCISSVASAIDAANAAVANNSLLLGGYAPSFYANASYVNALSSQELADNSTQAGQISGLNLSLQNEVNRAVGNESYLQSQVTSNLNQELADNSTQAGQIVTLNSSKAAAGNSSACGFGVQSFILSASGISVACAAQQGTVTSVSGDGSYVTGTVTSSGSFGFNESRLNSTIFGVGSQYFYNISNPQNFQTASQVNASIVQALNTTYYYPSSVALVSGTAGGGNNLGNISHIDYQFYNASALIDIRINFTNVSTFNNFRVKMAYSSNKNNYIALALWDYSDNSWQSYKAVYPDGAVPELYDIPIDDYYNHDSNGTVQARLYLVGSATTGDLASVDAVQLLQAVFVPSSTSSNPVVSFNTIGDGDNQTLNITRFDGTSFLSSVNYAFKANESDLLVMNTTANIMSLGFYNATYSDSRYLNQSSAAGWVNNSVNSTTALNVVIAGGVYGAGNIRYCMNNAPPCYVYYANASNWECNNGTGFLLNTVNASATCY